MVLMALAMPLEAATLPQKITISPVDPKTYGDAPFTVSASSSSGLPVVLSVSGPAELAGNTVTLTGAGKVVIKAQQPGDAAYKGASALLNLNVEQALLYAMADSFTRYRGEGNPRFTVSYSGFAGGDDETVLDQAPRPWTAANSESRGGIYPIKLTPGKDRNYRIITEKGALTVLGSSAEVSSHYWLGAVMTSATTYYSGPTTLNGGSLLIGSGGVFGGTFQPIGSNTGTVYVNAALTMGSAPYAVYGPGTYLLNGTTTMVVGLTGTLSVGPEYTVVSVVP
jgi:hypothetical protein